MRETTPMKLVAVPEFIKKFKDLFSKTAEITEFEKSFIESTYELLFFENYTQEHFNSLYNTARIAYKILEKSAYTEFKSVAITFMQNIERIPLLLNRAFIARRRAREEVNDDKKIEDFLSFYKVMYENLVPVLLAPLAISLGIIEKSTKKHCKLDSDGRVRLSFLYKMEGYGKYTKNQLSIGLNNHLRNSFAHERFRILDKGKVELWDIDPTTDKISWGPETWDLSKLEDYCESLWRNSLGIVYSLVIFSLNNRKIIIEGNFHKDIKPYKESLRLVDIKNIVENISNELSFDLLEFKYENQIMEVNLKTRFKGINQDSEVYTGNGEKIVNKYIVRMQYIDSPVIEQIAGLFQRIYHNLNESFEFSAKVFDENEKEIGILVASTDFFDKYKGKKLPYIKDVRKEFKLDTIGDHQMPVLLRSFPIEV